MNFDTAFGMRNDTLTHAKQHTREPQTRKSHNNTHIQIGSFLNEAEGAAAAAAAIATALRCKTVSTHDLRWGSGVHFSVDAPKTAATAGSYSVKLAWPVDLWIQFNCDLPSLLVLGERKLSRSQTRARVVNEKLAQINYHFHCSEQTHLICRSQPC